MKKLNDENGNQGSPGKNVFDVAQIQFVDLMSHVAALFTASHIRPEFYHGRKRDGFIRRTSKDHQCEIRVGKVRISDISGPDGNGEFKIDVAREVYIMNHDHEEYFFSFGMSLVLSTNGIAGIRGRRLKKSILALETRMDDIEETTGEDLFDLSFRLQSELNLRPFDYPAKGRIEDTERLYHEIALKLQEIESEVQALEVGMNNF